MIQGRILGALAGEDPILGVVAAAVGGALAEAGAEAGVQRLSLHVGRLQNLHQGLLALAPSQGHRPQEGNCFILFFLMIPHITFLNSVDFFVCELYENLIRELQSSF